MCSDVSENLGSRHITLTKPQERPLRSLCHVRGRTRAGGEVPTLQRDRSCLKEEETTSCSSFRVSKVFLGNSLSPDNPWIFQLVGIASVLKPQKCFTPRTLQGHSVVPLLAGKEKRGKDVLCKTLYFRWSCNSLSVRNIHIFQLEQRMFPQKPGSEKLTQTLTQCVTFLGKFQNGDSLYILTEVSGDEGKAMKCH